MDLALLSPRRITSSRVDAGDGGDVDGGEVHGDASGNQGVLATYNHAAAIGEQAMKAVGVAHG